MELVEWVKKLDGHPNDPLTYKQEYLRRLMDKISHRRQSLEQGQSQTSYLVNGVTELLQVLKNKGIKLYCASGTDDIDVKYEAKLLGLDGIFEDRIFGARDDLGLLDTKEMVLNKIINQHYLSGEELIIFGDGIVEIELCKRVGGYAVAVASDEKNINQIDEWKRLRLIEAGADLVIPFYDEVQLTKYLLQGEQ